MARRSLRPSRAALNSMAATPPFPPRRASATATRDRLLAAERALLVLACLFSAGSELLFDLANWPRVQAGVTASAFVITAIFLRRFLARAYAERRDPIPFVQERWLDGVLALVTTGLLWVSPRAAGGVLVVRLGISAFSAAMDSPQARRLLAFASPRPSQTVALSFVAMIGVGTVLLMVPAATTDGLGASFTDAAFTMTSAVTVTGLVVYDTGTYWTLYGQIVLLVFMQVGAVGVMVFTAAAAVLLGGNLSSKGREGIELSGMGGLLDVSTSEGLKKLILAVALTILVCELAGFFLLYGGWWLDVLELPPQYNDATGALWWSIFYSISAFCHAGFSLDADSLIPFQNVSWVLWVFMVSITVSQCGFPVMADIFAARRALVLNPRAVWARMHIQTKVVLVTTVGLNVVGMMVFLFFEYDGALSRLSVTDKLNNALFMSVTLRSAGFNTVPLDALSAPIVLIFLLWMFVGAAPGSVGGGVRTTTMAVVARATYAMMQGREDVDLFGRRLPEVVIYRSISIVLIAGLLVTGFLVPLAATQEQPLEKLVFEAMSAFGTVGLSMGITSDLDTIGRWLITALMYVGRVGPLTLALAVGRPKPGKYRYPLGDIAVG